VDYILCRNARLAQQVRIVVLLDFMRPQLNAMPDISAAADRKSQILMTTTMCTSATSARLV